jgi:phospholipid transport system transporter-binding protein
MSQDLTLQNALEFLEHGATQIKADTIELDLASLAQVDSSALAVLLALARRAPAGHKFRNPPESLANLAVLYGVDQYLFPAKVPA